MKYRLITIIAAVERVSIIDAVGLGQRSFLGVISRAT